MAGRARVEPSRLTKSGPRYDVTYRLGGQGWPERHGGTFMLKRDAEKRRDLINTVIASSYSPDDAMRRLAPVVERRSPGAPPGARTVAQFARQLLETGSMHLDDSTRNMRRSWLKRIEEATIGDRDVWAVRAEDVQAFVRNQSEELAPSTVLNVVSWLRKVFDYAKVSPNPARDPNVTLPRVVQAEPQIASWDEIEMILERIAPRRRPMYQLVVRLIECLGVRVGELSQLTWGDVDWTNGRIRVSKSRTKTASGQRWLAVPDELLAQVADLLPPDDRLAGRRVFSQVTEKRIDGALRRAAAKAGLAVYSAHDLRHRRISLWSAQGTPPALLSRRSGHSKVSMTQDVYSHVVSPDDDVWVDFWRSQLTEGR